MLEYRLRAALYPIAVSPGEAVKTSKTVLLAGTAMALNESAEPRAGNEKIIVDNDDE
ncbi:hypothetical protein SBA1_520015 [Candidatus Sulfotelmatobacter kueseliae]|uniref:Uncharacterized protein n=1 Tax=Candidatus Sulfotelmatobacter kueseliae TaxID=2042962 RepID=A0A2U3KX63_9BACT|nr:hypothetical protein SBA1_520015 [Candidatus Sulfotelmatobacter kueseliae]